MRQEADCRRNTGHSAVGQQEAAQLRQALKQSWDLANGKQPCGSLGAKVQPCEGCEPAQRRRKAAGLLHLLATCMQAQSPAAMLIASMAPVLSTGHCSRAVFLNLTDVKAQVEGAQRC